MNNLRKFGAWLWLNKERMILGVLVGFLCFRVYVIGREATIEEREGIRVIPPSPRGSVDTPQVPPPIPAVPTGAPVLSLATKSPFGYQPGVKTVDGVLDHDLTLVSVGPSRQGVITARIKKGRSRIKGYEVGEKVGDWEVVRIREDEQTVTISNFGQEVVLRIE